MVSTCSITLKTFLLPYARFFRSKGWIVDAMASGVNDCAGCKEAFDNTYNVTWSRDPIDFQNLQAVETVRSTVNDGGYDIVHVHTPVASFLTRFALRKNRGKVKIKIIYTAHGFHFHQRGNFLKNYIFVTLERLAGKWTDCLVVINRDDEEAARKLGIIQPHRLFYMPGIGVDTTFYSQDRVAPSDIEKIRNDLKLNSSDKLLLMIAEFNPEKRHIDALKALHLLNRHDVHLAFAGTGPSMRSVKERSKEMDIEKRVHFLGFREDIPQLICASQVVLLPSEREGLPRSVMESQCLGVPVVGYDIRGLRDLLSGGSGVLVPVGDIHALSAAIQSLIENSTAALEMGERGRKQMNIYDIKNIIGLHEKLYETALGDCSRVDS